MDSASNTKGSGAVIVLDGPCDIVIKYVLNFNFTANNNQEEYEAFVSCMILSLEMEVAKLKAKVTLS